MNNVLEDLAISFYYLVNYSIYYGPIIFFVGGVFWITKKSSVKTRRILLFGGFLITLFGVLNFLYTQSYFASRLLVEKKKEECTAIGRLWNDLKKECN